MFKYGYKLSLFGGDGKDIPVGDVYVDGNVDTRMGISMTRGHIYVSGHVSEPMGNLLEVKSDVNGYKKFRSITDIVSNGLNEYKLINFDLIGNKLVINDKTVKDTIGARTNTEAEITVHENVNLSTGILMRKGLVRVNGNAGKPIPPTAMKNLETSEQQQLIGYGFNPQDFLKFE